VTEMTRNTTSKPPLEFVKHTCRPIFLDYLMNFERGALAIKQFPSRFL